MKTFTEAKAARHARMTPDEIEAHEAEYARAGIAIRIAELFYTSRKGADMTQAQLAGKMRTSQSAIAEIESGGRLPTIEMLERLAQATGRELLVELVPAGERSGADAGVPAEPAAPKAAAPKAASKAAEPRRAPAKKAVTSATTGRFRKTVTAKRTQAKPSRIAARAKRVT